MEPATTRNSTHSHKYALAMIMTWCRCNESSRLAGGAAAYLNLEADETINTAEASNNVLVVLTSKGRVLTMPSK